MTTTAASPRTPTTPSLPLTEGATETRDRTNGSRRWILLVALIQLLLLIYFYSPWEMLGNAPFARRDYALHFSTSAAVARLLDTTGRAWGYDPYFMAGWPTGTVFDVDNKAFELSTWLLSSVLPIPVAFNVAVLIAIGGAPWLIYGACRVLGLSRNSAVSGFLLTLTLWYFDPGLRMFWKVGMVGFIIGSVLAILASCLFLRCFQADGGRGSTSWLSGRTQSKLSKENSRPLYWLCLLVSGPLAFLVHALSPAIMAIPIGVHLATSWRKQSTVRWLALVTLAGAIVAVNWYWISTLIRFIRIKTSTDLYLPGGLDTLWYDLAISDGSRWLMGDSPILRLLVLALACYGLMAWRRTHRELARAIGLTILSLLLTTYLASYLPGGRQIQPYRFLAPALLFAVLPAADVLPAAMGWIWRAVQSLSTKLDDFCQSKLQFLSLAAGFEAPAGSTQSRTLPRASFAVRTCSALLIGMFAVWQIDVGVVGDLPYVKAIEKRMDGSRLAGPPTDFREVLAYLAENTTDEGRILVTDWVLGALVPYFTGRQVIGGPFEEVWLTYGHTNADPLSAFGRPFSQYDSSRMRVYLTAYNVKWVVTDGRLDQSVRYPFTFDAFHRQYPDLATRQATIGNFNVYRVAGESSYFLEGCGQVTVDYDRIQVGGACPGSSLLKFHWLDTLRSEPELPLERTDVLDDPVGFIRVHNGEATSFIVYNHP